MTDMFSPGAPLRAAREKHRLTAAQIAEATRIKLHVIEAIEDNDFSRIAAPLYGKGFIKLYAEAVGLDPEPLIRDYLERHARVVHPSLKSGRPAPAAAIPTPSAEAETGDRVRRLGDAFVQAMDRAAEALRAAAAAMGEMWDRWRASRSELPAASRRYTRGYAGPTDLPVWRYAAIGVAVLIVAVLLMVGLRLAVGHRHTQAASPRALPQKPDVTARPLRLQQEPPPAHLRIPAP